MNQVSAFIALISSLFLFSCNQTDQQDHVLLNRIENLQEMVDNMYKPGFGDFMGSIQNHHNKLWFAGINGNWELASFEIHELEELFEDIKMAYPDRKESQSLSIINPGLEAVEMAVEERNQDDFKEAYTLFTEGCNACHLATEYAFIKITTPATPSFSNQDYTGYAGNELE